MHTSTAIISLSKSRTILVLLLMMTTIITMRHPVCVLGFQQILSTTTWSNEGAISRCINNLEFQSRFHAIGRSNHHYHRQHASYSYSSISSSSLFMGRRRSRRKRDYAPRNTMQIPESGIPEIAQVYPDKYNELLDGKVAKMKTMIIEAVVNGTSATTSTALQKEKDCGIETIEEEEPQAPVKVNLPVIEVFESPKQGYRMRANFKMWRTGNEEGGEGEGEGEEGKEGKEGKEESSGVKVHYVMFERGDNRTPYKVQKYPMGSELLQDLMDPVLEAIEGTKELRFKINDIRFLTTLAGDALVTITYNRPIGDEWCSAAKDLAMQLEGNSSIVMNRITFVGRSRKVKLVVGDADDTVRETLTVPIGVDHHKQLHYKQTEGAFSQPNAIVCQSMLGWAYDATTNSIHDGDEAKDDLCELYCGNGCFTVALAPNFRRVVATEMSKASVELAQHNVKANQIKNTKVARLNAEDFVLAYEGKKEFQRLQDAGIGSIIGGSANSEDDTSSGSKENTTNGGGGGDGGIDDDVMHFDRLHTLFVDPPRAGLDETCRKLAAKFDRVVYVSCNPETLSRDLTELVATHEITRLAAFDQFPYTPHLEAGVVLEKKKRKKS